MSIDDERFFKQNISNINKTVYKIVLASNLLPFLLYIVTSIGVFSIPKVQCYRILMFTVSFSIIDYFLIKNSSAKMQKIAMYVGLITLQLFVAAIGTSRDIGVYMCHCIISIVSCLYYNKKLSHTINIIGYLLMLLSMYGKCLHDGAIFDIATKGTFFIGYISVCAGFSIEFLFTALAINFLCDRNYSTLKQLINSMTEKKTAMRLLKKNVKELHVTQFKIIEFVAQCLGSHDLFTGTHVIHTQTYVKMIALRLRENGYYTDILTDKNIELYQQAAFLHDIGKIHIPEGILNKMGRYDEKERAIMNSHPEEGKKLLQSLPSIEDGKFNKIAIQMAYCHHEKWDGTGYPRGLKGKEIPLCARIMAAADVMDALISQRLYKNAMSMEQAVKIFEESSGNHFEPCIAQATIQLKDQIEAEDKKLKETESEKYKAELDWWKSYHESVEQRQQ